MKRLAFLLLMLTGTSLAQSEAPHPQGTYGAIKLVGEPCDHGWSESKDGVLTFSACSDKGNLLKALGRLEEADPQYEAKKAILIERINAYPEQAQPAPDVEGLVR